MLYNELIDKSEWVYHGDNSYLLIHKNASKTVMRALHHSSINVYSDNIPNTNIKWTVIREPMERMVSGLAFDIKMNPQISEGMFIDKLEQSLFGIPSPVFRDKNIHKENHTYTQSSYLINNPIDFYVDMQDLNEFLKSNFNYDGVSGIDEDKSCEFKDKARDVINSFGVNRIKDLLAFDTYIYNKILSSGNLWKWQHGKVFL